MNLSEFIELANKYGCQEVPLYEKGVDTSLKDDNVGFFLRWCKGGEGGNNCWGDENYEIEPESELYFDNVFSFIKSLKINSNIDDDKIQQVIDELIISWDYTDDDDYYGNYESFGLKFISVKKLFLKLSVELEFKHLTAIVEEKNNNKIKIL